MPLPGVTWPVRHEVGSSLVLHPLWESQQHPYVIVGGLWAVGSAVRQTHTYSGTKWLRKQTISARLFLISAQLKTRRSPKRLWRLKLNCKVIYWTNRSHRTPTFPNAKTKILIIGRVVQSGGSTISSSPTLLKMWAIYLVAVVDNEVYSKLQEPICWWLLQTQTGNETALRNDCCLHWGRSK